MEGVRPAEWQGTKQPFGTQALFQNAQQPLCFSSWKMYSCCYGESLTVSVPGTNCSKSFLVSTLSSAFISQFLARACGLQIKMSNSPCATEHTDPGHHCPFQSFLPEASGLRFLVDLGGRLQLLFSSFVFFILRGRICLLQKNWENIEKHSKP